MGPWRKRKKLAFDCGLADCMTCNPCAQVAGYWGETELLGVDSMNKVPSVPALVIVEQI